MQSPIYEARSYYDTPIVKPISSAKASICPVSRVNLKRPYRSSHAKTASTESSAERSRALVSAIGLLQTLLISFLEISVCVEAENELRLNLLADCLQVSRH